MPPSVRQSLETNKLGGDRWDLIYRVLIKLVDLYPSDLGSHLIAATLPAQIPTVTCRRVHEKFETAVHAFLAAFTDESTTAAAEKGSHNWSGMEGWVVHRILKNVG